MANELNAVYATGNTLYAVLLDATGDIYDTVGAHFETPASVTWTSYDIALTEADTTGVYRGNMPAVAAGVYYVVAYLQAGGSPATTDTSIGDGKIEWDGTNEIPVNTVLADTNELQGDWADGGRLDLILDARASQTTADAIETDTQNIQSRLPAALVSGRMDSDVGAIQTGAVTAAAIATDAIGAAELAADAVAEIADAVWDEAKSGHVGVGSFGEEVQAHALSSEISALNDISTAEVNTEVDTALTDIGLDHLVSAAVIGTDVTDNSIIAKMVSKSATADWDSYANTTDALEATADAIGALNDISTAQVNTEVDTALADYDAPTKAELDSGFAALNDPTAAAIADAVWDEAKSGHVGVGSFGEEVQAHALSSEISALNDISTAEVNTEVDTALTDIGLDHLVSAAVVGADVTDNSIIAKMASKSATADWDSFNNTTDALEAIADMSAPDASTIADAVWDEAKSGHVGVGSFGEEVQAHALSSEISALNDISTAEVNTEVDTALADYDPPTKAELDSGLAALNDPTAAAVADAVWDEAKSGHVGVGSFGEEVQAHALSSEVSALNDLSAAQVNAEVDTALADYDGPTNAEMVARTLVAADYFDPAADTVTVGTNNDKTGYALSAAGVDAILDEAVEGSYTLRQLLRLMSSALAGKVSGATTTTITFRDLNDGTDRIVATVDADGNRTALTLDAS